MYVPGLSCPLCTSFGFFLRNINAVIVEIGHIELSPDMTQLSRTTDVHHALAHVLSNVLTIDVPDTESI